MNTIVIHIPHGKYIRITSNGHNALYSYYNGVNDTPIKSSYNKYSFIEWLKSAGIPKKYIKEIERSWKKHETINTK